MLSWSFWWYSILFGYDICTETLFYLARVYFIFKLKLVTIFCLTYDIFDHKVNIFIHWKNCKHLITIYTYLIMRDFHCFFYKVTTFNLNSVHDSRRKYMKMINVDQWCEKIFAGVRNRNRIQNINRICKQ